MVNKVGSFPRVGGGIPGTSQGGQLVPGGGSCKTLVGHQGSARCAGSHYGSQVEQKGSARCSADLSH